MEKNRNLKLLNLLIEQEDRITSRGRITNLNLQKWESMGLKPYYYDGDETSETFGMNLISTPFERNEFDYKKDIFLLTDEELSKINKMTENTKHLISLYKEKIRLLKTYLPSVTKEMIENK